MTKLMVTVRVTPIESEFINKRALEHNITKAAYVRWLIQEDMAREELHATD